MPIIRDNNIFMDSTAMRLSRLSAIEENRKRVTTLLPLMDPVLASWMKDCFRTYSQILNELGRAREREHAASNRLDVVTARLHKALLELRLYLTNINVSENNLFLNYVASGELPEDIESLQSIVKRILSMNQEHKVGEMDYLPRLVLRELGDLLELQVQAQTHLQVRSQEREIAEGAERQLRRTDSRILRKLHMYWLSEKSDRHPEIQTIGMVNMPSHDYQDGMEAPLLSFDADQKCFVIDIPSLPAQIPTIELAMRQEGSQDWDEYAHSATMLIPLRAHSLLPLTNYEFSARCCTASGEVLSGWSPIINVRGQEESVLHHAL